MAEAYNDNFDDDAEYFKYDDKPARFTPIAWQKFAELEPNQWIIKGIFPRAELAVIFGAPGSGKTFMALDAAMSIARGVEWQKKRVKKGRVVYISAESQHGFKKRLKAYDLYHKLYANPENEILFDVITDCPNFLSISDTLEITDKIGKADVIIVDTFSRTMPGGNENSAEHVGLAIAHCKTVHETSGALVILIHHSGKNTENGARGWSGLLGACDTEIEITRIGGARKGRISKQKDGDDNFEWGFKLEVVELGTDEDGDQITSCVYLPANSVPLEIIHTKPIGRNQKKAMEVFCQYSVSNKLGLNEFIELLAREIPDFNDTRSTQKQHAKRTILKMIDNQIFDLDSNFVYKL